MCGWLAKLCPFTIKDSLLYYNIIITHIVKSHGHMHTHAQTINFAQHNNVILTSS